MPDAFGALVLLAFPFTDTICNKQRPALVLHELNDGDLILAGVTTQPAHSRGDAKTDDWREAGLLAPSTVRLHKIAPLDRRLVKRQLGELGTAGC